MSWIVRVALLKAIDADALRQAIRRSVLLIVMLAAVVPSLNAESIDPVLTRYDLAKALEVNYERLGPVELLIHNKKSQPIRGETIVHNLATGKTEKIPVERPADRSWEVTQQIQRHQFTYENLTDEAEPRIYFDGIMFTEYKPQLKNVLLRRPDQMASMRSKDIREMLFYDQRKLLHEVLVNENFDIRELADGRIEAALKHYVLTFDKAQGLLPVESKLFAPDGAVLQLVVVKYEQFPVRKAFYPKEVDSSYYSNGEVAMNILTTTRQIRAIELLATNIPGGVIVRDLANNANIPKGDLVKPKQHWRILLVSGTSILIILLGWGYVSKRKKR